MLRGYNQFANVKHDSKKLQTREDYENFVEGSLRQVILKNIANKGGLSYDNIRKEYLRLKKKEGPGAAYNYVMSLTQGMELSIQEENQLAMLQEILTDTKAYFDEVMTILLKIILMKALECMTITMVFLRLLKCTLAVTFVIILMVLKN